MQSLIVIQQFRTVQNELGDWLIAIQKKENGLKVPMKLETNSLGSISLSFPNLYLQGDLSVW